MAERTARLRPVEGSDLAFTRENRNDPAINTGTLGRRFPITEVGEREWFDSLGRGTPPRSVVFTVVSSDDPAPRGLVQLDEIDWIHRTAWFGLWIGSAYHGQGLGRSATELMLRYAVRLNLRRLHLWVVASNAPALDMYRSCGFVEEGARRGAILERGSEVDVVLMGRGLNGLSSDEG